MIVPAIQRLQEKIDFVFFVIADKDPQLPLKKYKFIQWNSKTEVDDLLNFHIGLMPLTDDEITRGKCGFKLIQYMAMGKPTLSTPLEANVKINRNNSNLFATNKDEWVECINKFISNESFYREVGFRNQKIVEEYYSVEANSISYINIFNQLFNVRN